MKKYLSISKGTIIINYIPTFILLFIILNFSTSSFIIFYPCIHFLTRSPFHGSLTCSVRKYRFSNSPIPRILESIKRYHHISIPLFILFSYLVFIIHIISHTHNKKQMKCYMAGFVWHRNYLLTSFLP